MGQNNFAQRFELLVKQEVKNYKDTVLAQNLAMNELRDQINDSWEKGKKNYSELERNVTRLERKFSSSELSNNSFKDSIRSRYNDIVSDVNKLNDLTAHFNERLDVVCLRFESLEGQSKMLLDNQKKINEDQEKSDSEMVSGFGKLKNFLAQQLDFLREEFSSKPSEIDPLKEYVDKQLFIYEVDFKGLLKEIEVAKKSIYTLQKNIENIYTQIERLK